LDWVVEAKKRFGLCVLDYVVTSKHIHPLVKDTGANVIAESMQLIAGRHEDRRSKVQGSMVQPFNVSRRGSRFKSSTFKGKRR